MAPSYFEMELLEKEENSRGISPLWKPLAIGSSILLFAMAIVVLITFMTPKSPPSTPAPVMTSPEMDPVPDVFFKGKRERTCTSVSCLTSSARILSSMNFTAHPCSEFYQFACGGWINQNSVPRHHFQWTSISQLELENLEELKNILEQDGDPRHVVSAIEKMRAYYKSCDDPRGLRDDLGSRPLLELIERAGDWNLNKSFKLDTWNFEKTVGILNSLNVAPLFKWFVEEDERNSSGFIIKIQPEHIQDSSTRQYFQESPQAEAYIDFMTEFALLLESGNLKVGEIRNKMKSIYGFRLNISETYKIYQEQIESFMEDRHLFRVMTLKELDDLCGIISWKQFFNTALTKVKKSLTQDDLIVVQHPDYFAQICRIVRSQMVTSKEVVNNYLIWHLIENIFHHLPKPLRTLMEPFVQFQTDNEEFEEPGSADTFCVSSTQESLGLALETLNDSFNVPDHSKIIANLMMNNLKNGFLQNLNKLTWIDPQTKLYVSNKITDMTFQLGFDLSVLEIDQFYEQLDIFENDYFGNVLRAREFLVRKNWARLGQQVEKNFWEPPTVSFQPLTAFYSLLKNRIHVPKGLFKAPAFDPEIPASLNYGAFGSILGHELVHGVDNHGSQYDSRGQFFNWFSKKSRANFKNISKCMQSEGGSFESKKYLGEKMADNGGLRAAFAAYKRLKLIQGDFRLPGLNMTNDQLFFIAHAQIHCSKTPAGAADLLLYMDPHAHSKLRVEETLKNMAEFSHAFQCPPNSPMNPTNKCVLW